MGGYTETRLEIASFVLNTLFVQSLAEFDMILHLSDLIFDPCRPLSCYSASATSVISGEFFLHCSGLYFPTGDLAIEETLVTCDKEADVCFGKVAKVVFFREVSLFSLSGGSDCVKQFQQ